MKMLRLQEDDDDYGCFTLNQSIQIQLSGLNRVSKDKKELIKFISSALHHEYLHKAIFDILWELWTDKEEEIVEKLSESFIFQSKKPKELYMVIDTND